MESVMSCKLRRVTMHEDYEFHGMENTIRFCHQTDEPTSFFVQVYLTYTQRWCKPNKSLVDDCSKMIEFPQELLRSCERRYHRLNLRHGRTCEERMEWCCELTNKQWYQVSTSLIDNHLFKKEELETMGELSRVCSRVVLKILHSVRIDRPDTMWSVIKVTRDVTKWTRVRGPFDIVHSWYEWFQTLLSPGKLCWGI